MEILAPLLGKLLVWLGLAIAILLAYLGIKRKGALAERAKWEAAQAEFRARTAKAQADARKADYDIDKDTEARIEALKKANRPDTDTTDPSKFRF